MQHCGARIAIPEPPHAAIPRSAERAMKKAAVVTVIKEPPLIGPWTGV